MNAGLSRYDGQSLTLVVNPQAGRGHARRMLPFVCAEILKGMPGASLKVYQTTSYREARQRTIAAVAAARPAHEGAPADGLLVMGGDGMMHLGVNACADTDVPLGLIPAGSGNDMSRGFGLPAVNPIQAAKIIATGGRRRVDLLRVSGPLADGAETRYVGTVVATGFDARVNRRANRMRLPLGSLRYAAAVIAEIATFEPTPYRISIDGRERTEPALLVAVGNAGYYGGGIHINTTHDVTDGRLDVTVIHPVSRATLIRLMPALFTGAFASDPSVEQLKATSVRIDGDGLIAYGDGEELGDVPLQIEIAPQVLSIFAPVSDQVVRTRR
ncbi:diacylglycerol/lipid kinase family protein [Granulicoccus phenolivorans]|uniref:diacylglycerol/lipid kinase family protein n=1 Tax=Granulicoccus phenolivorans TaxID=266854 RepID=UPI0003FAFEBF|nr:diacylglycerol kinase family protein [Granulicoccus phenolivorans]